MDVEGHQVHAEAVVLGLEQVVGQLLGEDVVELLPGLGGQAHQELVQGARHVHQLWVEEGRGEGDGMGLLAVVVHLLHQAGEGTVREADFRVVSANWEFRQREQ